MSTDLIQRVIVAHEYDRAEPKLRVKLTKAATKDGNYGWEVSYEGDDIATVLREIATSDEKLRTMTTKAEEA